MRQRPGRPQRTQQTAAAPKSEMEKLLETPEGAWRSARLLASTVFGTFAPAITALLPRFMAAREGLKVGVMTMGVDKFYRVYINDGFTKHLVKAAKEVSKDNPCPTCGAVYHHELAYVAGVICHEAQHPARTHSDRAITIQAEPKLFNIAADLEINDDLQETFRVAHAEHQQQGLPFPLLCLPPGVMFPSKFRKDYPVAQYGIDFPDDRIAEEYYYKLVDLRDKLPEEKQEKQKKEKTWSLSNQDNDRGHNVGQRPVGSSNPWKEGA